MYTLYWIFTNDHTWNKQFDTESDALDFMHRCGLLLNHNINRIWIESDNATLWLKEKVEV